MALNTFIGSTVLISASTPSTLNEAGFEGLTYTEIGQLMETTDIGDEINLIPVPLLKEGRDHDLIGGRKGLTVDLTIAYDKDDAGQNLLKANSGSQTLHTLALYDGHASTTSRWFVTCLLADNIQMGRNNTSAFTIRQKIAPQSNLYGPYDSTN